MTMNRLSLALSTVLLTATVAQAAPAFDDLRPLQGGWSAAKILDARVRSADGEDVGEIEDLVLSANAEVVAAVVSVGGVLGVADKLVAVPYSDLRVWSDGETLAISLTRAEADAAPAYDGKHAPVVDTAPAPDPTRTAPPDATERRAAEAEASRAFAGKDPRVADGIAENKKAYKDETAERDAAR
jgi:hypothetical protein